MPPPHQPPNTREGGNRRKRAHLNHVSGLETVGPVADRPDTFSTSRIRINTYRCTDQSHQETRSLSYDTEASPREIFLILILRFSAPDMLMTSESDSHDRPPSPAHSSRLTYSVATRRVRTSSGRCDVYTVYCKSNSWIIVITYRVTELRLGLLLSRPTRYSSGHCSCY